MCGRYAMALRPSQVRQILQNDYDLQVDDAPADEGDGAPRQSYNFAPGYNGVVYRADVGERGAGPAHPFSQNEPQEESSTSSPPPPPPPPPQQQQQQEAPSSTPYKLQSMKWGLIPFWTKSSPSYPSTLKTINCRDDSLAQPGGMWASMKSKKRCLVTAQGFYEWLQKGKEKIPHYIKRKDGKLMLLAGLWDCATLPSPHHPDQQEGEEAHKVWSYTIITTSSNPQLKFLHDRMPVILDPGSPEMKTWLDPKRCEWSQDLQRVLKPYSGVLEVYPVSKEVGKVGNNDPVFIVPVASKENKGNIANFFFANAAAKNKKQPPPLKGEEEGEAEVEKPSGEKEIKSMEAVKKEGDQGGVEFEPPLTTPQKRGIKREAYTTETITDEEPPRKKLQEDTTTGKKWESPVKPTSRPKISATSNHTSGRSPAKKKGKVAPAGAGTQKITKFFGNSA
ncbi:hypothetical protein B0T21DRAFT_378819 [Apiosordaria backusii]|uniref:DUF159-domain-containing protein n=1 Tax=Apiosordaria backusii TaxID=314023 RepID=A0AA39ZPW9_9PEZI|nr:hypothetical protein B0T21DRAFT_378819 [Apiosordaria backusii]